jgi:6-phosphogluconolactonase
MASQGLVFVGTYSEPRRSGTVPVRERKGKGIHTFRFDASSGALAELAVADGVRNSSYLAFHPTRRFLYCVNELKEFEGKPGGAVSAFAIEPPAGRLTLLNTKASHGADPCHLAVDRTGRNLLVANYSGGSVCVLPIDPDGSLRDASDLIEHAGRSSHSGGPAIPHAHGIEIDAANRRVFVPELGLDRLMIYELDAERGKLSPNRILPFVAVAAGAGPRQIVLSPTTPFAYLINELNSTISVFAYDAPQGSLRALQTVSTLPPGYSGHNAGAAVAMAPSGRFLYASNRGHDSIAIFAVDQANGLLQPAGHTGSGGRIPRNFAIDPSGGFLLAANQDSDGIVVFRIDATTGNLTPTGHVATVGTPVCVLFL